VSASDGVGGSLIYLVEIEDKIKLAHIVEERIWIMSVKGIAMDGRAEHTPRTSTKRCIASR
jgi:hypothetical protein